MKPPQLLARADAGLLSPAGFVAEMGGDGADGQRDRRSGHWWAPGLLVVESLFLAASVHPALLELPTLTASAALAASHLAVAGLGYFLVAHYPILPVAADCFVFACFVGAVKQHLRGTFRQGVPPALLLRP